MCGFQESTEVGPWLLFFDIYIPLSFNLIYYLDGFLDVVNRFLWIVYWRSQADWEDANKGRKAIAHKTTFDVKILEIERRQWEGTWRRKSMMVIACQTTFDVEKLGMWNPHTAIDWFKGFSRWFNRCAAFKRVLKWDLDYFFLTFTYLCLSIWYIT